MSRGDRIYAKRKQLRLTTAEAADTAGVSTVTWSKLENDELSEPRVSTIRAVAKALDVTLDYLELGKYEESFMDKCRPFS